MKDKRTNVGMGPKMGGMGGGGGGGSRVRAAPRSATAKRVNRIIQARYNATPRDQWPRIEVPRARTVSDRSAQRKYNKAREQAADAASAKVWGTSRKSINPALPANLGKTAMKAGAIGAAGAIAVKKTSGGKSPGALRTMEARKYEERKARVGTAQRSRRRVRNPKGK